MDRRLALVISISIIIILVVVGLIFYLPYHKNRQWQDFVRTILSCDDQSAINAYLKKYPPNYCGPSGFSLLHLAAMLGKEEVVDELLKRKADVMQLDHVGFAPIDYSVNEDVVRHLLAEFKVTEKIPIHHEKTVKVLIDYGADINHVNPFGPLLHQACEFSTIAIVQLLIENGANITVASSTGNTTLHIAVQVQKPELVQYLLSRGALVNAIANNGNSPLHTLALCDGDVDTTILSMLLQHGADVNLQNQEGRTPLMLRLAKVARQDSMIKMLIDNQSDMNIKDKDGKTAYDYAEKYNVVLTSEIIRKHFYGHSVNPNNLYSTVGDMDLPRNMFGYVQP